MELGSYIGVTVNVQFIRNARSFSLADCTRNSARPTMRFNLARLDDEFFTARDREQLGLVIHELGHAASLGDMAHGYGWGSACSDVGAAIALEFARQASDDS